MKAKLLATMAAAVVWSVGGAWGDTMLLVDGQSSPGTLASVETSGDVVWRNPEGKTSKVRADEVERIEMLAVDSSATAAGAWLVFADGTRIPGACEEPVAGKVNWVHRTLGKRGFAFEDLRAWLNAKEGRSAAQAKEEMDQLLAKAVATDMVFMANGDAVGGVVETLGADSASFNCKMGRLKLPTAGLTGITFSNTLKTYVPPSGTHARVNLTDGTVLVGSLNGSGEKVAASGSAAGTFEVARGEIANIELVNTKVVYLTDLEPSFVKETPYFDRTWNWQRDRSVWGRALTIGSWNYRRGIGMHAKCQLDFDLGGKYRVFLSDVGIDGETMGAGASVVVVYGDGKPLTEAFQVTGKTGPRQIKADVSGVKRLSLIADFGDAADAGDHVTWGNARLVKK